MMRGVAGYEKTHGVAEGRRAVTGTLSAEPCVKNTASVSICQVINKGSGLNRLRASRSVKRKRVEGIDPKGRTLEKHKDAPPVGVRFHQPDSATFPLLASWHRYRSGSASSCTNAHSCHSCVPR